MKMTEPTREVVTTPPYPPTTKKKQLIPDSSVFSSLDEHALKAPDGLRSSITHVIDYLIQATSNTLEIVRVFYRWITHNISYHTEAGRCKISPYGVLTSGTTLSRGYSNIFAKFCSYTYILRNPIDLCISTRRDSNEIFFGMLILASGKEKYGIWFTAVGLNIDLSGGFCNLLSSNLGVNSGEWRLIDCTLGAGYLDEDHNFHKLFNQFYFLTDPEDLIVTHFPSFPFENSPRHDTSTSCPWQLLQSPVSLSHFCGKVMLYPAALQMGIIPLSHKGGVISTSGVDEIRVLCPENKLAGFCCSLKSAGNRDLNEYVMVELIEEEKLVIHVMLPAIGTYILRLFGKRKQGAVADENEQLLIYKIICNTTPKEKRKFPKRNTHWGPTCDYKNYGFSENVSKKVWYVDEKGKITIPLETTRNVDVNAFVWLADRNVPNDHRYSLVNKTDTSVEILVRLPTRGFYELVVSVRPPISEGSVSAKNYHEVISYLLECREAMRPCRPFPEMYRGKHRLDVQLLEPLEGELNANTQTRFRIVAPFFKQIIAKDFALTKQGDIFEGDVMTPEAGQDFVVCGYLAADNTLDLLYGYDIINRAPTSIASSS